MRRRSNKSLIGEKAQEGKQSKEEEQEIKKTIRQKEEVEMAQQRNAN